MESERYEISLGNDILTYHQIKSIEYFIDLKDVIGSSVVTLDDSFNNGAYLVVHRYLKSEERDGTPSGRERHPFVISFNKCDNLEGNLAECKKYKELITQSLSKHKCPESDSKKFLIVINKCSGTGKAFDIFVENVVPLLNEAQIPYCVMNTSYSGHAKDVARSLKLSEWYGVCIVSGDGLLHEFINGLMMRSDWKEAIQISLAIIPAGSGNGLASSINYSSNESKFENFILNSAFVMSKHNIKPLDLMALDQSDRRVYSFLSLTWGLVADIDIGSEKYRQLGNLRFTISGISYLAKLKKYKGKLSYLPAETNRSRRKVYVSECSNQTYTGSNGKRTKLSRSISMPATINRMIDSNQQQTTPKGLNSFINGSNKNYDSDTSHEVQIDIDKNCENFLCQSQVNPYNLKLSDPLPDDWVVVDENEFVSVNACLTSHLFADSVFSPDSELDDGLIHLTYMTQNISRYKANQWFTGNAKGEHLRGDGVRQIKVKAFRLEPCEEGFMAVDGELIPTMPIQGQILPGMSRIMSL